MVGDGVCDNLQQLLLRVDGADREAVEKLYHKTSETLKGTWNAYRGADFDQNAFGCVNVDLELAGLVDRRV